MKITMLSLLMFMLNSACSTTYYLYQAGRGQLMLFNRAQPVEKVIDDPYASPDLVRLLKQVSKIKKFGEKYGLKPTPNYRDYVKLDHDAVVYVVTVSQPLKFEPQIFSFPLVGSFNYLGWFGLDDAKKFAATFEKEGLDVDVRGASAYSTLGWFKDPLLSSMIPKKEGQILPEALGDLVNVILHESVHATLYIKNQSYFNEGIASFIAEILTKRFFEENALIQSTEWKSYLEQNKQGEKVQQRMLKAYADLNLLYQSSRSDEEKRVEKKSYVEELQKELSASRKITNATLIQYQTYHSAEKDFLTLFQKKHEDVQAFLLALSKLRPEDFEHPQQEGVEGVLRTLY